MPRTARVIVLVAALVPALLASPGSAAPGDISAPSAGGKTERHAVAARREVTYSVITRGHVTASMEVFRRQAQETYADPRGWADGGVVFRRVRQGRRLHSGARVRAGRPDLLLDVLGDVVVPRRPLRDHQPGAVAARLAGVERRRAGAPRLPTPGRQPRDGPLARAGPYGLPRTRSEGAGDDAAVQGHRRVPAQPVAAPAGDGQDQVSGQIGGAVSLRSSVTSNSLPSTAGRSSRSSVRLAIMPLRTGGRFFP